MGKPRHRRRRAVTAALSAVVLLVVAIAAAGLWRLSVHERNIERVEGAAPTESGRPSGDPGTNWLLVGSDLRGGPVEGKWRSGEAHADAVMLLHLPTDAESAVVVSIPRDAWVTVPGRGKDEVSTAFREGGPALLTRTVEELADVRVDHFAVVDFHGFEAMVDALGGVDVHVKEDVDDPSNAWSWSAGHHRMDGEEALRFVRERKGLPEGTADRAKRQQALLKAMGEEAVDAGIVRDPVKLDAFLGAASGSLAVDEEAGAGTLRALAVRLARIGPEGLTFTSLPVAATDWVEGRNIARLDREVADGLFTALREDRAVEHVAERGLGNEVDRVR
ncbi:LytR family transcriptional attenuator [Haloactinospora alba]|uniref:LytR family transcriptional attenuator n=1 Tax=Haloactinospora alba TaxID=405555 RepID=A0A543NKZ1_9ACTN|nr:LCP family protein [Haloactinospora alba]TQN32503.1 LytR family transcriptional attenuator [Haloactinospora alba]